MSKVHCGLSWLRRDLEDLVCLQPAVLAEAGFERPQLQLQYRGYLVVYPFGKLVRPPCLIGIALGEDHITLYRKQSLEYRRMAETRNRKAKGKIRESGWKAYASALTQLLCQQF